MLSALSFLHEIGLITSRKVIIHVDTAAVQKTCTLIDAITPKNRHIETKYFKVCDYADQGYLDVYWRSGKTNPADLFTKALSHNEGYPHSDSILTGTDYESALEGGSEAPLGIPVRLPCPNRAGLVSFSPDGFYLY